MQACCLRGVSIGGRENHWPVDRTIFIALLNTMVVLITTMLDKDWGGVPLARGQNYLIFITLLHTMVVLIKTKLDKDRGGEPLAR